jgi:hypothetical protein
VILPRKKPRIPIETSIPLFAEEQEQRYFEIFCSKTVFDILPRFDSGTLREILLQTCMSEPSIRHAVVALGALDMIAETQGDTGTVSLDNRKDDPYQHHQNALKQYTTAIKHMKIASASGKQDLRTTLLTCQYYSPRQYMSNLHERENLENHFKTDSILPSRPCYSLLRSLERQPSPCCATNSTRVQAHPSMLG